MNCANHPETVATAFCRNCGKALCVTCQRPALGTVFCDEHLQAALGTYGAAQTGSTAAYPPPPTAAPYAYGPNPYVDAGPSPGLAFLLGLIIPGVGAVYNGQYVKGLIHALIFGLMISVMSTGAAQGMEPLVGVFGGVFIFYMAFEAYHTALKRRRGEPVDEFSSILPGRNTRGFPVGPVLLIGLGVLFLLNTLDLVRMYDILRFWPVFLIVLGGYLLYVRMAEARGAAVIPEGAEVRHD